MMDMDAKVRQAARSAQQEHTIRSLMAQLDSQHAFLGRMIARNGQVLKALYLLAVLQAVQFAIDALNFWRSIP